MSGINRTFMTSHTIADVFFFLGTLKGLISCFKLQKPVSEFRAKTEGVCLIFVNIFTSYCSIFVKLKEGIVACILQWSRAHT